MKFLPPFHQPMRFSVVPEYDPFFGILLLNFQPSAVIYQSKVYCLSTIP
jgi:hypothetical protein